MKQTKKKKRFQFLLNGWTYKFKAIYKAQTESAALLTRIRVEGRKEIEKYCWIPQPGLAFSSCVLGDEVTFMAQVVEYKRKGKDEKTKLQMKWVDRCLRNIMVIL